jgi:hypothetical protein
MKRIVKIVAAFIILSLLSVECSNYTCPAYKGMIKTQSQVTKPS